MIVYQTLAVETESVASVSLNFKEVYGMLENTKQQR